MQSDERRRWLSEPWKLDYDAASERENTKHKKLGSRSETQRQVGRSEVVAGKENEGDMAGGRKLEREPSECC